MAKSKTQSVPEEKYLIGNPPWAPQSWAIYLPNKHVWSSQEQTPERLVEIYGGQPTNYKELTDKGHFKDGLPKKSKLKPEDLAVSEKLSEIPM
jgi:hypothetical protein